MKPRTRGSCQQDNSIESNAGLIRVIVQVWVRVLNIARGMGLVFSWLSKTPFYAEIQWTRVPPVERYSPYHSLPTHSPSHEPAEGRIRIRGSGPLMHYSRPIPYHKYGTMDGAVSLQPSPILRFTSQLPRSSDVGQRYLALLVRIPSERLGCLRCLAWTCMASAYGSLRFSW